MVLLITVVVHWVGGFRPRLAMTSGESLVLQLKSLPAVGRERDALQGLAERCVDISGKHLDDRFGDTSLRVAGGIKDLHRIDPIPSLSLPVRAGGTARRQSVM